MFKSKLRVVSIGIAAENKALDSHEIPISPVELMPGMNGDMIESITEVDVAGVDKNGTKYNETIKTTSTLTAAWLPWGSNRLTSPDVRRGEHLLIWQYADVDKYYWTPMGLDDNLRRLETIVHAISATKDETVELDVSKNMYSLEVSSHGKNVTFHTTRANGEPFEYTMQLDTKVGKFFITDQIGNTITLNSPEHKIQAINADLTEVTLDKTKLYGYAKDDVKVRSDNTFTASSGGDMLVETEANLKVTSAIKMDVEVGADITVKGGANLTAQIAGNITVTCGGALVAAAGGALAISGGGGCSMTGAGGNMALTNGAATIKMVGPILELN